MSLRGMSAQENTFDGSSLWKRINQHRRTSENRRTSEVRRSSQNLLLCHVVLRCLAVCVFAPAMFIMFRVWRSCARNDFLVV